MTRHASYDHDYGLPEGFYVVAPWSGEVPPLPIVPDVPSIAPALPLPGNPLNYVVHGAEALWDDVWGWTSDNLQKSKSWADVAAGLTVTGVQTLVQDAVSLSQTAWSSFVNQLHDYTVSSVQWLTDAVNILSSDAAENMWSMLGLLQAVADNALSELLGAVWGIDQTIARQWWDTVHAIDNAEANVRSWSIDHIYNPLLGDIEGVWSYLDALPLWIATEIENAIAGIHVGDIPSLLAKIAALATTVAGILTWIEECGAPMCEEVGPNSDFSKLLKLLDIAGMLALLTAVGTLTESDIENLAATVVATAADPASAFVDLFVNQGDTLATAIADTLPQLAI